MKIANCQYPTLIMGCDALVDFLPGSTKLPINEKFNLLKYVYDRGLRGFDISVCPNFITAYRQLEDYAQESIIAIGNPNWKCGFMLDNQHLWDIRDRIRVTPIQYCFSEAERNSIYCLPRWIQERWFLPEKEVDPLTAIDIQNIYLNVDQLVSNLKMIQPHAKFIVFGSDYLDWFAKLNRIDLIEKGLSVIKDMGFIPLSFSHWPSITAPITETLPFKGHWIYFNELEQLVDPKQAFDAIKKLQKPISVFRVLSGGKLAYKANEAIACVIDRINPQSLVVGISSKQDIDDLVDNKWVNDLTYFEIRFSDGIVPNPAIHMTPNGTGDLGC